MPKAGNYITKARATALLAAKQDAVSGLSADPRDYGMIGGTLATIPNLTTRDNNAAFLLDALAEMESGKTSLSLAEFYWASSGEAEHTSHCVIEGRGAHTGFGFPDTSGIGINLMAGDATTSIVLRDFRLFGMCEWLPGGVTGPYTSTLIKLGAATVNEQMPLVHNLNVLGGYVGLDMLNCVWADITANFFQHQRHAGVRLDNDLSSDHGDIIIERNRFHGPNAAASEWLSTSAGLLVHSCSGLYVSKNKFYMRTDNGILVDLNHTTWADGGIYPHIEMEFDANKFDSGHIRANSSCIKMLGNYGGGGGGSAVVGNRVFGVHITNNKSFECVKLVDIDSTGGDFNDVNITGNKGTGGGSIKLVGTIDNIVVADNFSDNVGTGTGYGGSKFLTASGLSYTDGKFRSNDVFGYSTASDIADETASVDLTEAQTELTASGGAIAIPVNSGAFGNTYNKIDSALDITWDVSGDNAIVSGARGIHSLHYSGTSSVPAVVAPTGFTVHVAKQEDGTTDQSFPADVDDLHVDIHWHIKGTRIFYSIEVHGVITDLTSEGGGGFTLTTLSSNTWLYAFDPSVGVWDADTGGSEVTGTNNASVGRVVDRVDGTVAAAQATAGSRPVLKTNVLNGKAVLEFASDFLSFALEAAQSRPYSIFIVMKTTATDSNTTIRYVLDVTGGDVRLRLRPDTTGSVGTSHRFQFGDEVANGYIYPSVDYVNNTWRLVTGVAAASGDLRVAGSSIGTGSAGNNMAGSEAVYIGVDSSAASGLLGQIAFLGIQAGSNATDIANTESALTTYFAL